MSELAPLPFEPDDELDHDPADRFGRRIPLKQRVWDLEQEVQRLKELVHPGIQEETAVMAACAEMLRRLGPRQRQRVKDYLDSCFGSAAYWGRE